MPIFAVVTANEINQRLLGMICAAPLEIVTEQFSVPPSDLVVGEIPYSVCTRFVRDDRFFGLGYHPFFDRWIKRIGPVKSRSPAEVEVQRPKLGRGWPNGRGLSLLAVRRWPIRASSPITAGDTRSSSVPVALA